ncbi:hypothetical protein AOLI_G00320800 [Acnodon oligacanthus]
MDQEPEAEKALEEVQHVLPPIRGAWCSLPPIKRRVPVTAWAVKDDWSEKVGLESHEPSTSHPVRKEKSPDQTTDLPSTSLDALFSARLLGNQTPEPDVTEEFPVMAEQERKEGQSEVKVSSKAGEETVSGESQELNFLTVSPTVFKRTVEEVSRRLESVYGEVFQNFPYNSLVDSLIDEVELLEQIKVTDQVLVGRLFPDEDEAIRHIASEACRALLNKSLRKKKSCVDWLMFRYITDTVLISFVDYALACLDESGPSPVTDAVEERLQGSPEVEEDSGRGAKRATSLSCSTVLREQRPSGGSPVLSDDKCSDKCSEFPLKDSPDLSNCILEDVEIPGCPTGTKDAITTGSMKRRPLRSRISRFLRRVFCCGCIPSRKVVPL